MADDVPDSRRGTSDHRWQAQQGGGIDNAPRSSPRRFWIVTLSGIFLALASVVVLWVQFIYRTPPAPIYLTINIGEYDDRLFPPLGSTRKDAKLLLHYLRRNEQPETKDRQLLRNALRALKDKHANEPLILHLTAQAIVRGKKVYLLPGDAQPDDESTWVEVREVLEKMEACGATHKLLILDLAHEFTDPRLGVLADRVAETLEAQIAAAKPPFPVLCPCSAGQYSLTAEVVQGSVFAYYLSQGLEGPADANKDRHVTVKELAAFVEARVDRWARENHGLRQKPHLYFAGTDFTVVNLNDEDPRPADKLDPYPERLQKAWAQRDGLRDKAISRAPRLLHRLEANLLRQESLWRSGANEKRLDWKALIDDAQNLLTDLARNTVEPSAPPTSLALALGDVKDNPGLFEDVRTFLSRIQDSSKKSDINDKLNEELLKKLQEDKTIEFPQLASIVVEALSLIPKMKPDDVRVVQNALLTLKPRDRFVEHLYLQRLVDFAEELKKKNDPETWGWHADKTQMILKTMRSHQTIIAALNREPGFLPWIGAGILEADKLRQSGERKLLLERPSNWKDGFAELLAANRKYEEALDTFKVLRQGRDDLDRAYAELPGYGRFICDWPEFDLQAEKAWNKASAESKKLQLFYFDSPAAAAFVGASVPSYQRPFPELEKLFRRRMLAAEKEDGPGVLRQIKCLLDLPFLKATERTALLARQSTLAVKLHGLTDKEDQEDNVNRRVVAAPGEKRAAGDKTIGLLRARMALEMLRLAGFESKEKFLLPGDENLNPEEWTRIESAVRDRCGKELTASLRAAKSLSLADSLSRVMSPWETDEGRAELEKEPTRALHRNQRGLFFQWLQAAYESEARAYSGKSPDPVAAEFYQKAARELRVKGLGAN